MFASNKPVYNNYNACKRSTNQTVFVVRGFKNSLLGMPAISALQLLCIDRAEKIGSHLGVQSEIKQTNIASCLKDWRTFGTHIKSTQ